MEDTLFCHAFHCNEYVPCGDDNIAASMFSTRIGDIDTEQRFRDILGRARSPDASFHCS
jgi:hypothetical protein